MLGISKNAVREHLVSGAGVATGLVTGEIGSQQAVNFGGGAPGLMGLVWRAGGRAVVAGLWLYASKNVLKSGIGHRIATDAAKGAVAGIVLDVYRQFAPGTGLPSLPTLGRYRGPMAPSQYMRPARPSMGVSVGPSVRYPKNISPSYNWPRTQVS